MFKDVEGLVQLEEPKTFKIDHTEYKVWDFDELNSWDTYGKGVQVIRSVERTEKRKHTANEKLSRDKWQWVVEERNWIWATNVPKELIGTKDMVMINHKRWNVENQGLNELVNGWHADHVYKHGHIAILAILLLMFVAYNIFNIFFHRNIRDNKLKKSKLLVATLICARLMISVCKRFDPG